jgi:hypothetical protein
MMFGGFDAALPKYDLLVTVEAGSVDVRLDSDLSAAIADGETIVAGPRNIWTSDGVGGREFLTSFGSGSERQHRFVYFPIDGRVVRLAFEATPSLDTMELDEMIALTEIGE